MRATSLYMCTAAHTHMRHASDLARTTGPGRDELATIVVVRDSSGGDGYGSSSLLPAIVRRRCKSGGRAQRTVGGENRDP